MIPEKKKTAEEIAALREGLGIPVAPLPSTPPPSEAPPTPPQVEKKQEPEPLAELSTEPSPPPSVDEEPVIHLDLPPIAAVSRKVDLRPAHSLRKHDLPLAPALPIAQRTEIPTQRHDPRDVAQIRKREALAALRQPGIDPATHLRKQTASPFLYITGYLLAVAAVITAYQHVHYITPATLLALALLIVIFIALQKPRSRHHAALLFIAVFLTLAFGALHYAPLFQNAP